MSGTGFRFEVSGLHGKKIGSIWEQLEFLQPLEETGDGGLGRDPVPSNYGCACFHFTFEDDEMEYGLVQVVLTTVPLEVEYDVHPVSGTVELLERNLAVMKVVEALGEEFDVELDYGYVELEEDDDDYKRLTVYINDFDFSPEDTLDEVEARVDEAIKPLKPYLEKEPREDLLLYP